MSIKTFSKENGKSYLHRVRDDGFIHAFRPYESNKNCRAFEKQILQPAHIHQYISNRKL